ncbi:BatA and WFA domain-containing protein [Paenisporosarcina quisquiliarum]|uniref:BatA and WFA domain-containing protein n=1 Tax=Paenisporosarcina quisquiliarum TaxID=365346 RepID=A0A9X3RCJ8_9BACL|nr:BatA and WFA domain-containing protein [Paenisporosarcina quisquiliarum]MCZ8536476.1 BatA and WFA domain-containing protein [Paenisporosarcina quisquiliarum]
MGFGQLVFLWTAIIPITVLLYYFFRKKYIEKKISSTMFWETVMKETKVSPYLQYLQRNALFYLQMIALILLMLALLQPYLKSQAIAGEHIIWVVDTSATMLAEDNGESLFDTHKKEMMTLSEQLAGKPLTLITTGEEPTILLRDETNLSVIRSTIERLEIQYEQENLPKMLDFTKSLLKAKETAIYLFTDHVERSELPLENEHITWFVNGAPKNLENVSILRFGATASEKGVAALAQLENETATEKKGTLEIRSIENEEVLLKESVVIPANDTLSLSFKELPSAEGLKATLQIADDYKIDNESFVLMQKQSAQTYVDGNLHELVSAAFQAMDIPVSSVPTEQIGDLPNEAVVVTNQTSQLKASESPVLLIGRNDENAKEVNGTITTERDDVFAYADMSDIYVSSLYPPFPEYETLARVADQPFIQRSDKGDLIILSDIQMTDWPLHPSFPLFLWSAREQMATNSEDIGTFSPNERRSLSLVADEEKGEWEVFSSSNEYIKTIQNGGQFSAPSRPGLYVLTSGKTEKQFAVALEQQEKHIEKGTSFAIGSASQEDVQETVKTSMVPWLLLLIVLLLMIEWEVQRRRGITN